MTVLVEAVLIGCAVGIVVGALGAGGGILSVPVLVYVLGQDAHSAAASSLVIVGATAAVSVVHHARRGHVEWRRGSIFALFSMLASVVGSRASLMVPQTWLMRSFALLLLCVALAMFRQACRQRHILLPGTSSHSGGERGLVAVASAAVVTGCVTGFFGVGGGFLVVPMLVLVLGLDMRRAAGTSLVIMVVTAGAGLIARLGTSVVIDWPVTCLFMAGSMMGGLLGGPLSSWTRPWILTGAFAVLLVAVAMYTLWQVSFGH